MFAPLPAGSVATLAAILAVAAPDAPARASCDTIPPAVRWYSSPGGIVSQPLAMNGAKFEIRNDPTCRTASNQVTPEFPNSGLQVELKIGSAAAIALPCSAVASGCQWLGPRRLSVTMPDTRDASAGYPDGRYGPTSIVVRSTGTPFTEYARLDVLKVGGKPICDPAAADTPFQKFVSLPPRQEFGKSAATVLGALDGSGSMLFAFEYPPTGIPATEAGHFLGLLGRGYWKAATSADARAVRAFTEDGRPLPPVVTMADNGVITGLAKVANVANLASGTTSRSVLRIDGSVLPAPSPAADYLPIQLKPNEIKTNRCKDDPVSLDEVVTSDAALAWPSAVTIRKDAVRLLATREAAGSNPRVEDCPGTPTGEVDRDPSTKAPLLDVDGTLVAFRRGGSGMGAGALRAVDADKPAQLTYKRNAVISNVPALTSTRRSDRRAIVTSDPFVFFRDDATPPRLQVVRPAAGAPSPIPQLTPIARTGAVQGTLATVIGDAGDLLLVDASGQTITTVDTGVLRADASASWVVWTSSAGGLRASRLPLAGPPVRLGLGAEQIVVDGSLVYLRTSEATEPFDASLPDCAAQVSGHCDFNGDGDDKDVVVRAIDLSKNAPVAVAGFDRYPADSLVIEPTGVPGTRLVAFAVPEASVGTGKDLNQNLKIGERVAFVFDPAPPKTAGGATLPTANAITDATPANAFAYRWLHPYAIRAHNLFFLTSEAEQGDLDGDGQATGMVLQRFNPVAKSIFGVAAVPAPSAIASLPGPGDTCGPGEEASCARRRRARDVAHDVEPEPAPVPFFPTGLAGSEYFVGPAPIGADPQGIEAGSQLFGDLDGDAAFDHEDDCAERADPDQQDLDRDGVGESGDEACDLSLCTPFQPIAELEPGSPLQSSVDTLAEIGAGYLRARLGATVECLDRVAGTLSGTALTLACRGYFLRDLEVAPTDARLAERLLPAAKAVDAAIAKACDGPRALEVDLCGPRIPTTGGAVRRIYGTAANALSRLSAGDLHLPPGTGPVDPSSRRRAVKNVQRLLAQLQGCLEKQSHAECTDRLNVVEPGAEVESEPSCPLLAGIERFFVCRADLPPPGPGDAAGCVERRQILAAMDDLAVWILGERAKAGDARSRAPASRS